MDPVLEQLKADVNRLKSLLDDAHPGLFTWNDAVHRLWKKIVDAWSQGERKEG
jgi:hypothetical protein